MARYAGLALLVAGGIMLAGDYSWSPGDKRVHLFMASAGVLLLVEAWYLGRRRR